MSVDSSSVIKAKTKTKTTKEGRLYEKCQPDVEIPTNEFIEKTNQINFPLVPASVIDECTVEIAKDKKNDMFCFATKKIKQKRSYYEKMEDWINRIAELDQINYEGPIPEDKSEASPCIRVATYISFFLNLCLLLAKSVALHSSQSYTIISSLCDSCLDLIAGVIISYTAANSKFTKDDVHKYPLGKARVSIVGILVFSILMACCALYIIIQCLMSLAAHECAPKTTSIALCVMKHTITTKLIMAVVYRCLHHPITDTLADDHRNDVLTNSFGMFMYWGGEKLAWWMDSVGGIVLSMFVLISWCGNAAENAKKLIGESASDELVRDITYVSASHSQLIKSVERVLTFQVGPQYITEVHIIVSNDLATEVSHRVGETLQLKLEHFPEIERAFVHVDVENHNRFEHVLDMRLEEEEE